MHFMVMVRLNVQIIILLFYFFYRWKAIMGVDVQLALVIILDRSHHCLHNLNLGRKNLVNQRSIPVILILVEPFWKHLKNSGRNYPYKVEDKGQITLNFQPSIDGLVIELIIDGILFGQNLL